ncbi:sensor domain-containing protein [Streptomyces sp. BI20]|uniref:sensor domain-containing protein n=1 Tax=Streptomyces sp. BI20 TaxID=3403460 RepID=UPI003C76D456
MSRRTTRVALAALAASSLLLVTACTGDEGKDKAADKPAAPPKPKVLSEAQARTVLVKPADIAPGWKLKPDYVIDVMDPAQYTFGKADKPACQPFVDLINTGRVLTDYKVTVQQVIGDPGDKTNVAQDVSGYADAKAVQAAVQSVADGVAGCAEFGSTAEKKPVKVRVKPLKMAAQGEQSTSLEIVFEENGADASTYTFESAIVRVGANVTYLHNNLGEGGERNQKGFAQAVAKAAENLKKVTPAAG